MIIRPIFGRGNTQALYHGPVEQNGAVLDESQVTSHVASNAAFWQYIEACKRGGREVGVNEGGFYSWRLSIQFLDQSGAAALIEDKTSAITAEAYEFYRGGGSEETKDSIGVAMLQTFREIVSSHTKLIADLADSAQKAACAAVKEAMAPLTQVVDRVSTMSKEDTTRADEMTKAAMKLLREQQPKPDVFDGIAKVVPAGAIALKALKDLKN